MPGLVPPALCGHHAGSGGRAGHVPVPDVPAPRPGGPHQPEGAKRPGLRPAVQAPPQPTGNSKIHKFRKNVIAPHECLSAEM